MEAQQTFTGYAQIDLSAVRHNVGVLARRAPNAQVMAVVKADAYGHGLLEVARAAVQGGAQVLGAAQLNEALTLRAVGHEEEIFTWLHTPQTDFAAAVAADLTLGLSAPWALVQVAAAAADQDKTATVHLKVDTGLHRNGAPATQFPQLLEQAAALQDRGLIKLAGVWSHFSSADLANPSSIAQQVEVLDEAWQRARAYSTHVIRHIANSAATLTVPQYAFDLVRPGIALYGLTPSPELGGAADFGLRPVMSVHTNLALVKPAAAGAPVSYGQTYHTAEPTQLGLVPLGYANGVSRLASGPDGTPGAPVQINGQRHHISGRVCMDQFVVDLGPTSSAQAGDEVVLYGGESGPTAEEWAAATNTINYEVVTRFGANLPRHYVGIEEQ